MTVKKAMRSIAKHVEDILDHIDDDKVEELIMMIKDSDRVFLTGAGRSKLAGQMFATRLIQLGIPTCVIGDCTTPAVRENDLVIAVSGSGQTMPVIAACKTVKEIGAKLAAITSYPDSPVGKLADVTIIVKGRTKIDVEKNHLKHQLEGVHSTLTPLGTLFEDTVTIFFDGVIAGLMTKLEQHEIDLKARHATLE